VAGRRPDATAGRPGCHHLPAVGGDPVARADQAEADSPGDQPGEHDSHQRADAQTGQHAGLPGIDVSGSRLLRCDNQPNGRLPNEQFGHVVVDVRRGGPAE
jgi:hypothetical protein